MNSPEKSDPLNNPTLIIILLSLKLTPISLANSIRKNVLQKGLGFCVPTSEGYFTPEEAISDGLFNSKEALATLVLFFSYLEETY